MPQDAFILKYKENYVTQFTPEKFWDFPETGPWSYNENEAGVDLVINRNLTAFVM